MFAVGIYAIGLCNLAVLLHRGRRQGVRCKRNNREDEEDEGRRVWNDKVLGTFWKQNKDVLRAISVMADVTEEQKVFFHR